MDQHSTRGSNTPDRDKRPPHIANIAHHFFDESLDGGSVEGGEDQVIPVIVGCASGNALAAGVCAQLALACSLAPAESENPPLVNFPIPTATRVFLAESPLVPWSAISHLPGKQVLAMNQDEVPAGLAAAHHRAQLFWEVLSSVDEQGNYVDSQTDNLPSLVLHNLGSLNSSQLEKLEALEFSSDGQVMNLPQGQNLIWCLGLAEAGSLLTAYTLGRVMALFQPRHLEVILVGDRDPGNPTSREGDMAEAFPHLMSVAGSLPCHFSQLPRSSSLPSEELLNLLAPAINRIISSNSD